MVWLDKMVSVDISVTHSTSQTLYLVRIRSPCLLLLPASHFLLSKEQRVKECYLHRYAYHEMQNIHICEWWILINT
uniref:Uncharacterized protein n=1 Tax=Anguilla anguilla TaxID=7936 RepID=A0A0E9X9A1_ANGAN